MAKKRRIEYDAMTENQLKSMLFGTDRLPNTARTKRLKNTLGGMLADYQGGYF